MQNGRIIQTGTAEEIVLTPADDYVAEFVLHMNPLTVLTGSMVMQRRAHLPGHGTDVWLDPGRRYQLSLNATGQALSLTLDGIAQTLRYIRDEVDIAVDEPGLTVAPASMSLQGIIQLRQNSGHPVLVAEEGTILGVCGEHEIIRALSRGRRV
jgi:glycine betaine/proline transport system ATP-binding protein